MLTAKVESILPYLRSKQSKSRRSLLRLQPDLDQTADGLRARDVVLFRPFSNSLNSLGLEARGNGLAEPYAGRTEGRRHLRKERRTCQENGGLQSFTIGSEHTAFLLVPAPFD